MGLHTASVLLFLACTFSVGALGRPTLRRELLQDAPKASGKFPDPALTDNFVEIVDGDFVLGCNSFPISGWNQWELMEAGAGAPLLVGSVLPPDQTSPEFLSSVLDSAVQAGVTVIRGWAHGTSPQYPSLLKPGEYNEGMLRGLDFLLDEARKRGLKLILSFTSNWTPTGGVDEYANMTGTQHNDFFSNPATMALYQDYLKTIVTRTNTINGRAYKDDPTIMAWDLINEPVCKQCGPGAISKWVKPMAAYVKSLDPQHLVTVGEEGFYSATQGSIPSNPMAGESTWATEWSQDFVLDHSDDNIDFAGFHIWPDLWKCTDCATALPLDFFKTWISQHVTDAALIGKPLILEEFGKQNGDGQRDAYFQAAYDAVDESLKSGGPLKGALFWQFYAPGQTASPGEGGGAGKDGVYAGSSTFDLAKANAATTQALAAGKAAKCTKKAPPAATCGKPGFEGPDCEIDINECIRGTATCGENALCVNKPGSFSCECPVGTTKSGADCKEDLAGMQAVLAGYWTDPSGKGQVLSALGVRPQRAFGTISLLRAWVCVPERWPLHCTS